MFIEKFKFIKDIKKLFLFMALLFTASYILPMAQEKKQDQFAKYDENFKEFDSMCLKNGIKIFKFINRGLEKIIYAVQINGEWLACSFYAPYKVKNGEPKEFNPSKVLENFEKDIKLFKKIQKLEKKYPDKKTNLISFRGEGHKISKRDNKIERVTLFTITELGITDLNEYIFKNKFNLNKSINTKLNLAIDTANGIYTFHKLHLIHRDIKPGNIIIVPESENKFYAVITDFSFAKKFKTKVNFVAFDNLNGTNKYLAPENISQLRQQVQINKEYPEVNPLIYTDPNVDIYALGVTLYELFYEKPYDNELRKKLTEENSKFNLSFSNDDYLEHFFEYIRKGNRPALDNNLVPEEINNIIKACLAQEPEDRPTAKEVLNALTAIKEDLDKKTEN
ncbi:MAG: hypothetical protein SZ59_C0003G0008 [candidate division TM6 bacterium GW2011_GWF2_28_16]|nr:MAG: hypothetical protein SZ59_C0003G0008 [candidate division TM6 bacterium GW2011_GWF2_28_16]